MDNQKSNEGSGRDLGREGAGSSMAKDTGGSKGPGGNSGAPGNSGASGNSGAASNSGASSASTAASGMIDKAKDMAKDLSKDVQSSASDAHKTIDKAAEAAQPIVDRLATSAHAGVDKISGALAGATEGMDAKTRQLADAARNFADTGRGYVRSSPATSVLVALGAGYILSKILGGRR